MKTVIVGAGISGLATAHALLQRQPQLELVILEATERVGGKIWTDKSHDGFVCESGVNAFLDNKPMTLALSRSLHLTPVPSSDAARHRFVYSQQRLQALPTTPPSFLTSNLLSLKGRLRVMIEPLLPRGQDTDESLAAFARRRLGREAFERLIDPMASGVYAGNPHELSLKSCFPRIHEVEQQYRSLILGLIRLQLKARRQGRGDTPTAGPGGRLTSFRDGMSSLPLALAHALGPRLRLATGVQSISHEGERYILHLSQGGTEEAERVILTSPAHAQAKMLHDLLPELSHELNAIPYPPVAVCCLGFRRDKIRHDLNGFGFLIPSREGRNILGTLWDSSLFPQRAPEGYVLLRSMVGGAQRPDLALLPEAALIDAVHSDLRQIMGVQGAADFVRVYRHEQAIPQYVVGHGQRLQSIASLLQPHPHLILSGNAFKGVALNDCVANAHALAESLYPLSAHEVASVS
jgi:oxygen-dependent protoporphyrinogen oxidase